ncbi:alpha-amylase family protein [Flavimaricola marinus]|uniref:Amylosucrase n=1 Tax=Flavimaricola marinus TaxID=1819565 RepID=A0A238LDB3_9RHOB|nr:alpha-amylase family protein [Flavimaricola marinus]SMY06936.1 Amylosucrase [Flavimaricola marinus]
MSTSTKETDIFDLRFERSASDLLPMLDALYSGHPEYKATRQELIDEMRKAWKQRPADLKTLDLKRDLEPDWFQRPDMVGYVFYIDRFAGNLKGIHDKLDYLESLGVTYVHLMPCLKPRPGDSDGGYSVMDYRKINPDLGTMTELQKLAKVLRERGISLCIDMVLNHTAKEHEWAQKARKGDPAYQDMYLMFDDDRLPKAYEQSLVEVFPDNAPGNFTYYDDMEKWVWTTFNEHQWDLNWANPRVFLEIAKIMMFLANKGLTVMRLDAVAFMWKRLGTRCQSEPEVHMILRALRAVTRIVAASVLHLEEAIVGPAEMLTYFGRGEHDGREGNLAYHNNLMVQYWSALATRDTGMMTYVMRTHFPENLTNATYATYARCHDDIGWAITDEDANAMGVTGQGHRAFLSDFYEGVFEGSFARGALFQSNEETGDKRISGTFASLAGLERALESGDDVLVKMAVERILMGNALIASYGGVPLIYMGDEIALLNEYSYLDEPDHAHDSRWLHRPHMDWNAVAEAEKGETPAGQILAGTRHILARRKATPQLHGGYPTRVLDAPNNAIFAFARITPTGNLIGLFNFSEYVQVIPRQWLVDNGVTHFHDALANSSAGLQSGTLTLLPYGRAWVI